MKTLNINGTDYKLEYSFESAEYKDCVQAMFKMVSGAYVAQRAISVKDGDEIGAGNAMIDGMSEMVADIPNIVRICFYAGFLENNPVSKEDSKNLMRTYMKENKVSYSKMYEMIKDCMEEDGFFDLSGLTEMLQTINEGAQERVTDIKKGQKKKTTATTK